MTNELAGFSKEEPSSLDVQKYIRRRTCSAGLAAQGVEVLCPAEGAFPSHKLAPVTPRRLFVFVLQLCLNEWIHMTGFLCSLGGVCVTDARTVK